VLFHEVHDHWSEVQVALSAEVSEELAAGLNSWVW
jgi:hypothetical protein